MKLKNISKIFLKTEKNFVEFLEFKVKFMKIVEIVFKES